MSPGIRVDHPVVLAPPDVYRAFNPGRDQVSVPRAFFFDRGGQLVRQINGMSLFGATGKIRKGRGRSTVKPIDIPTQATAEFIASYVSPGASVLEVGCGRGHVARELLNRGYRVNAVDADPESVAEARERGVPAVQASWPDHEGGAVDAVAFTRSFHHIGPLAPALRKARELSSPTGMLLVEDFAFDEADAPTIAWLLRVLRSRTGSALVASPPGEFVTEILGSNDPDASWRQWHHDHGVHTAAAMKRAIGDHFAIRETRSVPYLYRYLVPAMPETAAAAAFVDEVFHEEARLGERSAIVLVGRRTVADAGGRQAPLRT